MRPLLAMIPCAYEPAKLLSVIPENGTGDFTVSRNGGGTRVNKNGLIELMPAHVPRFDYDPLTGNFVGVLREDVATNLIFPSDKGIGGGNGILDLNSAEIVLSPVNIVNGYYPTPTSLASRFEYIITSTQKIYRYSWFAKRFFIPSLNPNVIGDLDFFGLINCTVSDVKIEKEYINGWKRFSCLVTKTDENVNSTLRGYFGAVIGTGNKSVAYFGHQLTTGSVTTSYIPTTTTTVTRPADIITVTVPAGATEVVYVNDGVQTTLPVTAGSTFQLPVGLISKLWMN